MLILAHYFVRLLSAHGTRVPLAQFIDLPLSILHIAETRFIPYKCPDLRRV